MQGNDVVNVPCASCGPSATCQPTTAIKDGSIHRHLYISSRSSDGDAHDLFVVEGKSSQEQFTPNEDVIRSFASFVIPERWCEDYKLAKVPKKALKNCSGSLLIFSIIIMSPRIQHYYDATMKQKGEDEKKEEYTLFLL